MYCVKRRSYRRHTVGEKNDCLKKDEEAKVAQKISGVFVVQQQLEQGHLQLSQS
jgi:hypothetical protein